jgi:D-threo-aldose 1-dehydrogenase
MVMSASALDERTRLGSSAVGVQSLGLGLAPLGRDVGGEADRAAWATIERAWERGIRTFDVAPFYGEGRAERRAGDVLRALPRDEFTLSTKTGRAPDGSFDFSASGIRRGLERSLERLGLDHVDTLLVHDPDRHMEEALHDALPEVLALRDEGAVGAVGVGMNHAGRLARFVREAPIDCVLSAGQLTLLDGTALDELVPECEARGVSVIVGGVFNSGILANPTRGATFGSAPASEALLDRAQRLEGIVRGFEAPLASAALHYPMTVSAAIACVLVGVDSPQQVDDDVESFLRPPPVGMWRALAERGGVGARSAPHAEEGTRNAS